LWKYSFLF